MSFKDGFPSDGLDASRNSVRQGLRVSQPIKHALAGTEAMITRQSSSRSQSCVVRRAGMVRHLSRLFSVPSFFRYAVMPIDWNL